MDDLGAILTWLKYRRQAKNRKIVSNVLLDLHSLIVTVHGRMLLGSVINDPDNELEPELRRMFWILLETAPVAEWAGKN